MGMIYLCKRNFFADVLFETNAPMQGHVPLVK